MENSVSVERGDATTAGTTAGVLMPPPLIPLCFLLLGAVAERVLPAPVWQGKYHRLTGSVLIGAAVAGGGWAARTMHAAKTPVSPMEPVQCIVSSGPFASSRNPIYTCFNLMYLGIAIAANNPWSILLWPAMITMLQKGVVEREERYLETRFGDEYRAYKVRVRRWL